MGLIIDAFSKTGSHHARLALSFLFIMMVTIIIMIIYEVGLVAVFPGISVWQSIISDVIFTSIMAPIVAVFILLKFESLYRNLAKESEERKRAEDEAREAKQRAELYLDLMGHDINNMNQIALGYLEMVAGMVEDEQIKEVVKKPLEAIQNSSKLIDNVRKIQKFKDGNYKLEKICINSMLVELRSRYVNVPGKEVTIDYSPIKDCYVMADPLLKDAFSNLIGNAIKHSDVSKSVHIYMGLDCIVKNKKNYCQVVVEDQGPGIPDKLKEKIFARMDNTSKLTGRGLGLYIVKSLVEGYNGSVYVEDRVRGDPTQGARFVIMLPAIITT